MQRCALFCDLCAFLPDLLRSRCCGPGAGKASCVEENAGKICVHCACIVYDFLIEKSQIFFLKIVFNLVKKKF